MQLDDYVRQVHDQISASAALGDERTQQIAAALATGADAAVRLAIMSALSAAADEITTALLDAPDAPAVVIHLDGSEARVTVSRSAPPEPEPAARPADDGEANARISLRLTEALKGEVETAAAREGISVNSWLVRAANTALGFGGWGGPGGWPGGWGGPGHRRGNGPGQRITGWING